MALQPNPSSGAILVGVGVAAVVGWLVFGRKKKTTRAAQPAPTTPPPTAPPAPPIRLPPVFTGPGGYQPLPPIVPTTNTAALFGRAQQTNDPAEVVQIRDLLAQRGASEAVAVTQALSVFQNGIGAPKNQFSTVLTNLVGFPGLTDTLRVRRYLDIRYSPSLSSTLLPSADLVLAVARAQSDPEFLRQINANIRWSPPPIQRADGTIVSGGPSMTAAERLTWGEVLGAIQIYDAAVACGADRACIDQHTALLRQRGFNRLAARF